MLTAGWDAVGASSEAIMELPGLSKTTDKVLKDAERQMEVMAQAITRLADATERALGKVDFKLTDLGGHCQQLLERGDALLSQVAAIMPLMRIGIAAFAINQILILGVALRIPAVLAWCWALAGFLSTSWYFWPFVSVAIVAAFLLAIVMDNAGATVVSLTADW